MSSAAGAPRRAGRAGRAGAPGTRGTAGGASGGAGTTRQASVIGRQSRIDLAVVVALGLLASLGFQPVFGQYLFLLAAVGGLVVGAAAVVAGRLLRLPLVATVALAIVGFFLFGSALAMPGTATAGFVPNLDTLSGLVRGAVFGWSDAVTLRTPLEAPPYIAVVPYVAAWAAAVISAALALWWLPGARQPALRRAVAVAPPLALLIATILLGTRAPYLAGIRGIAFTAIALVWVCWRGSTDSSAAASAPGGSSSSGSGRSELGRRKLIGTGVVVLGALLVGGLVGTLVQPAEAARYVLRDQIVPPFDPVQYPSPLAAFRHYVNDQKDTTLFSERGLPSGSYVRLATMDSYDGTVWNVSSLQDSTAGSGSFELLGRKLPEPKLFTPGLSSTAEFTIKGYTGTWLPVSSYPTSLQLDGSDAGSLSNNVRVNAATGTVALTSGVRSGIRYQVGVTALKTPSEKALGRIAPATVTMPPIQNVPDVVTSTAKQYAGSATSALQKLLNIEHSLQTFGYLAHGRASDPVPSRAGEGADRMEQLLTATPMVGDEEQYVTAFALMAHSLGYPVRVVLGTKVPSGDGQVDITGSDVTAWAEVPFEGVGWVPFFPTPTKTDAPKEQTVKPKVIPQPQVRQPPRDNPKDDQLLTPVQTKDKERKKHKPGFQVPVWAYVAGGSVLLLALIVLVPLLVTMLLRVRRRRRRRSGPGDRSAAGAWDELRSRLAEHGLAAPARPATRRQLAGAYESTAGPAGVSLPAGTLGSLAQRVDGAVFAAGQIADDAAETLWREVDAVIAHVREGASWLRRRLADYRYSRR